MCATLVPAPEDVSTKSSAQQTRYQPFPLRPNVPHFRNHPRRVQPCALVVAFSRRDTRNALLQLLLTSRCGGICGWVYMV